MKTSSKLLAGILVVIGISSCATTNVWVDKALEKQQKTVAIVGFELSNTGRLDSKQDLNRQISNGLGLYFLKAGFSVTASKGVQKVLKDNELSLSDVSESEVALEIGKKIDVSYVVYGSGDYSISGSSAFLRQFTLVMLDTKSEKVVATIEWHGVGVPLGNFIEDVGKRLYNELVAFHFINL